MKILTLPGELFKNFMVVWKRKRFRPLFVKASPKLWVRHEGSVTRRRHRQVGTALDWLSMSHMVTTPSPEAILFGHHLVHDASNSDPGYPFQRQATPRRT
jgi:hypothetical protein